MSVINWFSKIADWKIISDKTWLTFLIPLYGPMGRFWLPGRDDLVLPLIKSIITMKLFSFQNLAWNDLSTAQLFPTPAIPESMARRCGPSMTKTFPLGVFSNSVPTSGSLLGQPWCLHILAVSSAICSYNNGIETFNFPTILIQGSLLYRSCSLRKSWITQ